MTKRNNWRRHLAQDRVANLHQTLTDIAALEGRLMGTLDLNVEQIATEIYGPTYLTPWEKLHVLLKRAVQEGL